MGKLGGRQRQRVEIAQGSNNTAGITASQLLHASTRPRPGTRARANASRNGAATGGSVWSHVAANATFGSEGEIRSCERGERWSTNVRACVAMFGETPTRTYDRWCLKCAGVRGPGWQPRKRACTYVGTYVRTRAYVRTVVRAHGCKRTWNTFPLRPSSSRNAQYVRYVRKCSQSFSPVVRVPMLFSHVAWKWLTAFCRARGPQEAHKRYARHPHHSN